MLVLSRKQGQGISIGEDILIEVRQITRNRVSLSINAPKIVRILRGELSPTSFSSVLDDDYGMAESTIDTVIMRAVPVAEVAGG
jgi:carbon storage regulator CsrA